MNRWRDAASRVPEGLRHDLDAGTTQTRPAAPAWARWAAWATVLCTIPSCVWWLALGVGIDVGFTGELGRMYTGTEITTYVLTLSILSQGAACLTLGLVYRWGEVIPDWVPRLRGGASRRLLRSSRPLSARSP